MRNNDVLIPFGSVDPWHERRAVHRVHELVRDYGVKGFKFHPSMQAFEPNDRRFYPIYEAIAEAGVPALFHTGQTGIGAGLPGGHGIKLRYSDPMLLDDVAADFPELTIVMAHPAVPWVDAQIAIATHKANVYIDLSRLVAEVLPAAAGARRRPSAAHEGAVRHRLPVHPAGPLAPRLRGARHRPGGGAADLQGQRAAGARGSLPSASRRKRRVNQPSVTAILRLLAREGDEFVRRRRSISVSDPATSRRRPLCPSVKAHPRVPPAGSTWRRRMSTGPQTSTAPCSAGPSNPPVPNTAATSTRPRTASRWPG